MESNTFVALYLRNEKARQQAITVGGYFQYFLIEQFECGLVLLKFQTFVSGNNRAETINPRLQCPKQIRLFLTVLRYKLSIDLGTFFPKL